MRRQFKIIAVIMIMIMAIVNATLAAGPADSTGSQTDTPTYKTTGSFTIKAYKSSPDQQTPVILSVYDALTGNLDEVGGLNQKGQVIDSKDKSRIHEIDVYPYLDKFLSTNVSLSKFPAGKEYVLFSYLVSGGKKGNYTLDITIDKFTRQALASVPSAAATEKDINVFYKISDMNYIFPARHTNKTKDHEIVKANGSVANGTIAGPGAASFKVKWNVNNINSSTAVNSESWLAEGIVYMAIDKASYEAARSGNYKALVKVKLTYN